MNNDQQPNQPPVQPPVAPAYPQQPTGYQPQQVPGTGYTPQPSKSNMGLIIGLVIGGILLLMVIGGIVLAVIFASAGSKSSTSSSSSTGTDSSTSSNSSSDNSPSTKAAYTAKYSSDFSKVCDGTPIANAADFTTKQAAIIATYSKRPESTIWSGEYVGYGKSYYLKDIKDFTKVSVVSCLKTTTGAESASIPCTGKDTDPTINYHSVTYAMTFYEAKTGKKIADGGTVTGPADTCPSFTSYNTSTLNAFATPDDDQTEAALDSFVR